MVKLKLHGTLWQEDNIPQEWDLCADSLSEAIQGVQANCKRLYKHLLDTTKKNIKYAVIINGRNFYTENEPTPDNPKSILESELMLRNQDLKTIDIVPILEGADSKTLGIITAILGVVLIIVGIFTVNPGLILAGVTLLAAGVFTLLSKPPRFEDFREIEQGGKTSYLFSGPQNIVGEGGPVPLCYGSPIVGSQVVSASYVIRDFSIHNTSRIIRDEYGNLTFPPKKHAVKNPFPF